MSTPSIPVLAAQSSNEKTVSSPRSYNLPKLFPQSSTHLNPQVNYKCRDSSPSKTSASFANLPKRSSTFSFSCRNRSEKAQGSPRVAGSVDNSGDELASTLQLNRPSSLLVLGMGQHHHSFITVFSDPTGDREQTR